MEVVWFLPTFGDGRYLGTNIGGRPVTFSYLKQIAVAADELGYGGVLIPSGRQCEDSWSIAAALAPLTERLKFLVALRPGTINPTAAARMANTIDRISNGRLLLNVVVGGDPVELAGDGVFLVHDDRYAMTDEFLTVWHRLRSGEETTFEGQWIKVKNAQLFNLPPATGDASSPKLWIGGSSPAAQEVTAKHIDVYLTWGEPQADVNAKLDEVRRRAQRLGRKVRFGARFQTVVRETEAEAWAAADALLKHVDDDTIASVQRTLARLDSEGQRRTTALHGGRRDRLIVGPNLWAGIGLVRGGVGTALVGSPENVAARLKEYAALGIEYFILSGLPHLEEAYRFAELVFPLLPVEQRAVQVSDLVMGVMGDPIRVAHRGASG